MCVETEDKVSNVESDEAREERLRKHREHNTFRRER